MHIHRLVLIRLGMISHLLSNLLSSSIAVITFNTSFNKDKCQSNWTNKESNFKGFIKVLIILFSGFFSLFEWLSINIFWKLWSSLIYLFFSFFMLWRMRIRRFKRINKFIRVFRSWWFNFLYFTFFKRFINSFL